MNDKKEIARWFFESVVNKGDISAMHTIMAENFTDHYASPDQPPGIEGFAQFLKMVSTAFPDISVIIEDIIAEEDKVAVRLTITGTHSGMLLGKIHPTGKKIFWSGIDILRIKNGKITDRWSQRDLLGMMRQIGVI